VQKGDQGPLDHLPYSLWNSVGILNNYK
jgi:hypothetical protein